MTGKVGKPGKHRSLRATHAAPEVDQCEVRPRKIGRQSYVASLDPAIECRPLTTQCSRLQRAWPARSRSDKLFHTARVEW